MQEARLPSQAPQLTTQVPISVLSFGLMGVICGVLTGVIDAMQSSGAYVLLGATSLHMIVGCVIGLLCGLLYALSPRSLQLNYCIEMTQQFLSPPRQVSDYQRGRAVASVWLWAFVVNWVMPGSAALGHSLSGRVSTPIFSMIISIAMLTLTGMLAVPFVAGASRSGGRVLASIGGQVRHLTSLIPASMHPILLVASGLVGLKVLALAIPPVLTLLKGVEDSTLSAAGILALGVAVAATLRAGATLLTGAKFKTLISSGLRLLRFKHKLSNPLLHLTLAIFYSIYHFASWITADPQEWREMSLHQVTLVTLFFLPLFIGGEYLRPFIKYSKKWGVALMLLGAVALGYFGVSNGLAHKLTRESLYQETTSSAFMLRHLRSYYDKDGDGVAYGLGELDCDDTNPAIYPGAPDVPGNDIDEDCDGYDLSVITLQTVKPPEGSGSSASRSSLGGVQDQVIRAETIEKRGRDVVVTKPLFERIEGPHSLLLITLPGLTSESIEPQALPPEEDQSRAKRRRARPKTSDPKSGAADETLELRSLAPAIHQFAQGSMWVKEAYATTPDTTLGLLSLFTGRYPSELIRDNRKPVTLSRAMYTVPEVLSRSRYKSLALVSDAQLKPQYGLNQGFSQWDQLKPPKRRRRRRAREGGPLSELITRSLKHINEVPLGQSEFELIWIHSDELLRGIKPLDKTPERLRARVIEENRALYREALKRVDAAIAQLSEALSSEPVAQRNFTIVISGLHGYSLSGQAPSALNEAWLKSALLMRSSEVKPRVIDTPTSLLSLAPTLLDFAEIESFNVARDLMRLEVKSISEWALGELPASAESASIYAEHLNDKNELIGRVRRQYQWKLYQELGGRNVVTRERLYDLKRFGEDRDRSSIEATRTQVMRSDLELFVERELRSVSAFPKLGR